MSFLGRGGFDQVVHQLQSVVFIADVPEGVVPIRLIQIDQIQHPDVIALTFQISSGGEKDFRLGVGDDIVAVGLQNIGLHIPAGLGGAGTADDQHVQASPVLVGVQPQRDVFRKKNVLLLGEHGVDLPGIAPRRRAVLLAVPPPALLREIDGYCHDIDSGTEKDYGQAFVRPAEDEGVFQGIGQGGEQFQQVSTQRLSDQQRRPNHEGIQKEPEEDL